MSELTKIKVTIKKTSINLVIPIVLSIPTLVLWDTHIPRRKKIILLSIFSATILIMVFAIIRVVVDNMYDREINIAWLCF